MRSKRNLPVGAKHEGDREGGSMGSPKERGLPKPRALQREGLGKPLSLDASPLTVLLANP
jgi:hypothetical protein